MSRMNVWFAIEKEITRKPRKTEDQDPRARALRILEVVEKAQDKAAFKPKWASPPGDTLKEYMEQKEWDAVQLAIKIRVSPLTARKLLVGNAEITPRIALALEKAKIGNAYFWIRREADYRLARARLELKK